ncbi:alpha/beta hydrolase family protein [Pseudomonas sp. LRF_L74]|uniref:alpha/beta hydrolase family protein n=1 Tax=Pseudomonas sp. LRF_L74 TaxID=3369422 RepID=UPI003F623A19
MKSPVRQVLFAATMALLPAMCLAADEPAQAPADAPPASPPNERAALAERSAERASALERLLPKREQKVLKAGDSEFLSLWKPANRAESTGIAIIIPSDGESANWPLAVGPLRNKLPDAGWSTLVLSLPDRQPAPAETSPSPPAPEPSNDDKSTPPATTEAADPPPGSEPANAAVDASQSAHPVADPAERVFARIEAGLGFAEEQKTKAVVLVGHGEGGYWAARFVAERKPAQVAHLIVIAPQVPVGLQPALDELVPALNIAVGDFYYKDSATEQDAARLRLQASKREKDKRYTQVALNAIPGNRDDEQEQLYRRIRGWLDKRIPGSK